jgi:hypothetical protein
MLERIPLDRDEALLSWPRRLLHSAPLVKGSVALVTVGLGDRVSEVVPVAAYRPKFGEKFNLVS